jgi:hypothetical protein
MMGLENYVLAVVCPKCGAQMQKAIGWFREPLQKPSASDRDIISSRTDWRAQVGGNEAADAGDSGV